MQTSTKGSFVAVWNRETNKKVRMIRCELQNGKTKGNKSGVHRNKMFIHEKEGKRKRKKLSSKI